MVFVQTLSKKRQKVTLIVCVLSGPKTALSNKLHHTFGVFGCLANTVLATPSISVAKLWPQITV